MLKVDAVITVAGWEERFVVGLERDLQETLANRIVVLVFEEYDKDTLQQRAHIKDYAARRDVQYGEITVRREPVPLWSRIKDGFDEAGAVGSALVDISTMPREVIWWIFSRLLSAGATVNYVYHKPVGYAPDWLTRDTDQPRLVYQHSGISEFGKETCLVLISGFDTDRIAQLIQFFEPRAVAVGLQVGAQFDNQHKTTEQKRILNERFARVEFFDVDAYSEDHGLASIEAAIADKLGRFNIVTASLGPKPSAVALYRIWRAHPEIALSYAPSRQFNKDYSKGIGDSISGVFA